MCKPMGNFAENLNLGKRVLPPPSNVPSFLYYFDLVVMVLKKMAYISCTRIPNAPGSTSVNIVDEKDL